jgi:hypothetical protein
VVDGASIGAATSHTITNVHETHTIVATGTYLGGDEPPPPGNPEHIPHGLSTEPMELHIITSEPDVFGG